MLSINSGCHSGRHFPLNTRFIYNNFISIPIHIYLNMYLDPQWTPVLKGTSLLRYINQLTLVFLMTFPPPPPKKNWQQLISLCNLKTAPHTTFPPFYKLVVWIPICIMFLINLRSLCFAAMQRPDYVKGGASPKWTKLFHEYPICNTCLIR